MRIFRGQDRLSRANGFTLFELVIVLVIIAAAVTVIVPYASRSNESLKLSQQCLNIVQTMEYAIDLAASTQRPTRITIDRKNDYYLLEIATDMGSYEAIDGFAGGRRYISQAIHIIDIQGFDTDGRNYHLVFDPGEQWPEASLSLASIDLIKTITIKARQVEVEESTI